MNTTLKKVTFIAALIASSAERPGSTDFGGITTLSDTNEPETQREKFLKAEEKKKRRLFERLQNRKFKGKI